MATYCLSPLMHLDHFFNKILLMTTTTTTHRKKYINFQEQKLKKQESIGQSQPDVQEQLQHQQLQHHQKLYKIN
ncbi:hypothetical protein DDB_G0284229 [Dictyostelium discoideum AX4]|uniref:Putative uncharacterized protein DDB_G0284229 n=1 Tax=Dictyostelium discoideum TaxID=44689 RepID=Y8590_DICDI|nr:hypothetical protein DDB_G0284229 [Dictyostelium discoideum AX4]Q54PY5.1 RecName: Full=Putative uncharacterized protein DDB_G0284229 [Dictyostelium discoideum]EAL65303.1 hypothetical protein DDB_G0284229 [Dictyostelium discoideum AX4]|eukprot:XP_638660.1 hypothetical protein DDB_G0284229 [Dictyostelium discoideum AX4]